MPFFASEASRARRLSSTPRLGLMIVMELWSVGWVAAGNGFELLLFPDSEDFFQNLSLEPGESVDWSELHPQEI